MRIPLSLLLIGLMSVCASAENGLIAEDDTSAALEPDTFVVRSSTSTEPSVIDTAVDSQVPGSDNPGMTRDTAESIVHQVISPDTSSAPPEVTPPQPASAPPVQARSPAWQSRFLDRNRTMVTEGYANAKRGLAVYLTGIGLDWGISLPMSIAGAATQEPGLSAASLAAGAVASGFKIAGPIRCGVGGSMVYDGTQALGVNTGAPRHWALYKTGWAFRVLSAFVGVVGGFATEQEVAVGLAVAQSSLTFTSDVLWISSCATSVAYSRRGRSRAGLSLIDIGPVRVAGGSGLAAAFAF
ncbi:MAG: hypothetical protein GF331_22690 [Chitinivibrionales bacterium]|nr:hypothetical protein [Chitinivibrionales bacterium]